MKILFRFLGYFVLPIFGSVFFLAACSPMPSQPGVPQTQQPSQQPSTQKNIQVTVLSPDLNKPLKSPITIHGKVSGVFFYEAVFPIVLQDIQGKEIARTMAHADNDWMTEQDVPFTAELSFKTPKNPIAKLIFIKDNPSGLPANNYSQSFGVTLK